MLHTMCKGSQSIVMHACKQDVYRMHKCSQGVERVHTVCMALKCLEAHFYIKLVKTQI